MSGQGRLARGAWLMTDVSVQAPDSGVQSFSHEEKEGEAYKTDGERETEILYASPLHTNGSHEPLLIHPIRPVSQSSNEGQSEKHH